MEDKLSNVRSLFKRGFVYGETFSIVKLMREDVIGSMSYLIGRPLTLMRHNMLSFCVNRGFLSMHATPYAEVLV